ncbi:hypothetical protein [Aureliella helgolandensis]|uniref:Uncharacterized protein n=1 Tax=Aureliella helgolandensis TaxID=2527968 RepID=A0A518G7T5_9BACT|nr:hypothetical protein [Aureliella helgolandensis]QDV24632.1 hypothetical protein Q31a_29520 [Aureliella helgolandensis]
MANVTIYAEHRDMLDALITSGKVASIAGATKTGPFKDQRDAYVFAASIAIALNNPTAVDSMPKTTKDNTLIKDHTLLAANGGKEIAITVAMTTMDIEHLTIDQSLSYQLDLISEERVVERLSLLDRFAHAGFKWLAERRDDESSIRDLMLTAIDEIDCLKSDDSATEDVRDPLLDLLDMQL